MQQVEYIRPQRNLAFPYGVYHQLISAPMGMANPIERQAHSYGHYRSIDLTAAQPATMIIGWKVPDDYLYLFQGFTVQYERNAQEFPTEPTALRFLLRQPGRGRTWNQDSGRNVQAPVFTVATTPAGSQQVTKWLNHYILYGPGDTIEMEISGDDGTAVVIRLLTIGLRIPREVFTNQ
jgi:hypothetical protein